MKNMKDSSSMVDQFPGFQIYSHREELEYRCMSRLQKRAPCPLQIKPSNYNNNLPSIAASNSAASSSSSSSSSASASFSSFFTGKDPIPLLSPLVVLAADSTCIRGENTAKSH
ncbi:hypothetical protein PIB30_037041 [Stylosanthes scabra]|uniref:Uncharacterized protein n=1 Tax=Stylosanthes scabra TaxID=79078 RepID=A0ABU6TDB2_9FABA|nr:hypothetical protein [Stylosanthes scabra]